MFVLALDCSTAHGSVALGWQARDEPPITVWQMAFPAGRGHGGKLFTALQEALALVKEDGDRLERIVVGLGPGSYSGVRQAIAAATGLAAATGAQLVGVPSAAALDVEAACYQAVGDARRRTFYYTAVENGVCVVGPELLENREGLQGRLAERQGWAVFAVESSADGITDNLQIALPLAERLLYVPTTSHRFPPLEPIYLRPVAFTLPRMENQTRGNRMLEHSS